jgi:hypothetical protein
MSLKIIGIVGKKGVGKDTMADFLISSGYDCIKMSFAEPLKKIVVELFHLEWDDVLDQGKKEILLPQWNKTPRQLLQWIGTDIFRKYVRDDIWILHLQTRILKQQQTNPSQSILITDVRFPNEADLIRRMGGILVRIVPSSFQDSHRYLSDPHSSEMEQDSISVDYVLYNDKKKGKENYRQSVLSFFHSLSQKKSIL